MRSNGDEKDLEISLHSSKTIYYLSYAVQFHLIDLDRLCVDNGLFVLFKECLKPSSHEIAACEQYSIYC